MISFLSLKEVTALHGAEIEAAISPRTRAVCIVHLYGRNAYTDKIGAICRAHNLKLIEDNAQAHGCPDARMVAGQVL